VFSRRLDWTALERQNALAVAERRRREAGAEILDLTASNPTAVGLAAPAEALGAALAGGDLGAYRPAPLGPAAARAAVAAEYARLGAAVDPARLALTASSSESYALLWKLLCDPGDAVLVPEPSYPLFDYLAALEGVALRRYRLAFAGDWHVDWSSVDIAGVRAVVVVSPNNPTGSFLRRDDYRRLAGMCAAAGAALVVDEVFADYALDRPGDAVATVAAEPPPAALTFALGGLSKSCGLPQMKLGWLAALGPGAPVAQALARLELICDTYLSVGAPVLAGLPGLLALGAGVRAAVGERLRGNLDRVRAAVHGTPCTLLPVEGGWSAVLRVPATRNDEAWALALLTEDGVLVQPGYFFELAGLGSTLVLSLLTPSDRLAEGMTRLVRRVSAP
jgi:alanine-synthesizing transaminase